jgi:hypothetical protein
MMRERRSHECGYESERHQQLPHLISPLPDMNF